MGLVTNVELLSMVRLKLLLRSKILLLLPTLSNLIGGHIPTITNLLALLVEYHLLLLESLLPVQGSLKMTSSRMNLLISSGNQTDVTVGTAHTIGALDPALLNRHLKMLSLEAVLPLPACIHRLSSSPALGRSLLVDHKLTLVLAKKLILLSLILST